MAFYFLAFTLFLPFLVVPESEIFYFSLVVGTVFCTSLFIWSTESFDLLYLKLYIKSNERKVPFFHPFCSIFKKKKVYFFFIFYVSLFREVALLAVEAELKQTNE